MKVRTVVKKKHGGEEVETYEADSNTWSVMGLMWTKEMSGRLFTLANGRRVCFSKHCEGHSRRYTVELAPGKD